MQTIYAHGSFGLGSGCVASSCIACIPDSPEHSACAFAFVRLRPQRHSSSSLRMSFPGLHSEGDQLAQEGSWNTPRAPSIISNHAYVGFYSLEKEPSLGYLETSGTNVTKFFRQAQFLVGGLLREVPNPHLRRRRKKPGRRTKCFAAQQS